MWFIHFIVDRIDSFIVKMSLSTKHLLYANYIELWRADKTSQGKSIIK